MAQEINRLKKDAGIEHAAFRIRFDSNGSSSGLLAYTVEKATSCSDPAPQVQRTGSLFHGEHAGEYAVLGPAQGAEAGIPGLVLSFCYDFLSGSDAVLKGENVVGFGILPVKDLAEHRQDRMTILLLSGPLAETSFD